MANTAKIYIFVSMRKLSSGHRRKLEEEAAKLGLWALTKQTLTYLRNHSIEYPGNQSKGMCPEGVASL